MAEEREGSTRDPRHRRLLGLDKHHSCWAEGESSFTVYEYCGNRFFLHETVSLLRFNKCRFDESFTFHGFGLFGKKLQKRSSISKSDMVRCKA